MTTNRTPIERPALTMISPKAIELFAESERARRARKHATDCTISEFGLCKEECRACNLWWSAHNELHDELHLDPWVWPCISHSPYPPGSAGEREYRPGTQQKELYDLLKEARRAAAATKRETSSSQQEGNPNVDADTRPDVDSVT